MDLPSSTLANWLKTRSPVYYGKLCEIREVITGWLSYIPQSFPHYTRHTIEHSDKIIEQISKVLFDDDQVQSPRGSLTATEAYILCSAAMLHDSGMVVSDAEKATILASDAWREWTSNGTGADRWIQINSLRDGSTPPDPATRNFLADVQVRFMIAEFVRAKHHLRSGELLQQSEQSLARFHFDDPILLRTIAAVCVGHGINHQALDDTEAYPVNRDIRGDKVDVRWLAILLRLGDLLDMDSDRACPLLLNAACPLPGNSIAHWTQYKRIVHRSTTPTVIEIRAECVTQEEHRVLADWCSWIHSESENSGRLLAGSPRHFDWKAPRADLGKGCDIVIRPANGAEYIPTDWTLRLDETAVLDRLINSTQSHPLAYLRELIQNAIDATRCQLSEDLVRAGSALPVHPVTLSQEVLRRYPIRVSLSKTSVVSELSGEAEPAHWISIADSGIGMDESTIQKYFLQVGCSYYSTAEFRRQYPFHPIGRFGVGFLSVFSASDHVTVITRTERSASSGLRLTLTGPRNYLLLASAPNAPRGTSIQVRLRSEVKPQFVMDAIRNWCKRIEFPIVISTATGEETITSEGADKFETETEDLSNDDAHFQLRSFPFILGTIRGEIYIFSHEHDGVISWDQFTWAKYRYIESHPLAQLPDIPETVMCIGGIDYGVQGNVRGEGLSVRLDFRGVQSPRTLDRQTSFRQRGGSAVEIISRFSELASFVKKLFDEHLQSRVAAGKVNEWTYVQRMINLVPLAQFWKSRAGTTRVIHGHDDRYVSIDDLVASPSLTLATSLKRLSTYKPSAEFSKQTELEERSSAELLLKATMTQADLARLASATREWIFGDRVIAEATVSGAEVLILRFEVGAKQDRSMRVGKGEIAICPISHFQGVGMFVDRPTDAPGKLVVLNSSHKLIAWLATAKELCQAGVAKLDESGYERLMELIADAVGYALPDHTRKLNVYLEKWRTLPGVAQHMHPPHVDDVEYRQTKSFGIQT